MFKNVVWVCATAEADAQPSRSLLRMVPEPHDFNDFSGGVWVVLRFGVGVCRVFSCCPHGWSAGYRRVWWTMTRDSSTG